MRKNVIISLILVSVVFPTQIFAQDALIPKPPVEEKKPIQSYFRIDQDYMFGLQLWAGAAYPISNKISLAADIFMPEVAGPTTKSALYSYWGEFDLGPAFTLGPVTLTPMAGIAFDWGAKRAIALNAPQLYTIINIDRFYFESWVWTVLYSPFKDKVWNDYIHTRNWFLFKINDIIAVGPQFEYMYYFKNYSTPDDSGVMTLRNPKGTAAMPLGGHIELAFGTGNSLGLFLGYELNKDVRTRNDGNALSGRFSFVHNF
ncbi:MAG: hypothetical protein WC708_00110 [Lentisphaeria bacterium]|jgi:hypothetical protein